MKEFPKAKYHEDGRSRVVANADEESELGQEWANSPADFGKVTAPSLDQLDDRQHAIRIAQAEVKAEERNTERNQQIAPDAVQNLASEKMGADPRTGGDPKSGVKKVKIAGATEFTVKTSGDGTDAGDWTQAGDGLTYPSAK